LIFHPRKGPNRSVDGPAWSSNVTQLKSVDKSSLAEKIGSLTNKKMEEVAAGLKLVMDIV
jgi:mRNA-degrading endonuclease toxin of MazEF toxin-antitoxin module